MTPLERNERRGAVILLVVVLVIGALSYLVRRRPANPPIPEQPTVVYRTVTDTVYRVRRKRSDSDSIRKSRAKRHRRKATKKGKDAPTAPPRDFLSEPLGDYKD